MRERCGFTAAAAAVEAVLSAQRGVVSRIAAARATTIAGLQVRARVLAEFVDQEEAAGGWDRMLIAAIVGDLAAMSETITWSPHRRRPLAPPARHALPNGDAKMLTEAQKAAHATKRARAVALRDAAVDMVRQGGRVAGNLDHNGLGLR